ncbi:PQQ-binding-like beta-propeller repeat protein [Natrinema versiforme]|nr:PQQ-binding-like beta-propeller repeat protein [Natrinema versiforme]
MGSTSSESPSVAWRYDAPDIQAIDGDETQTVIATEREIVGLDRANGEVAWRHRVGSITGLERDESGYYGHGDGGVVAIDRSSGAKRWQVDERYTSLHRAESALVCYDFDDRKTVGFDPETGDRLWTWDGGAVDAYTATFGIVTDEEYRGVDLNDGTTEWRFRAGQGSLVEAVADENIVLSIPDDSSGEFLALVDGGTEQWRFEAPAVRSWDCGVIDGTVYAATKTETEPRRLHAIDFESGRERWSTELDSEFDISEVEPVAAVDEAVLVSTPWTTGNLTGWKQRLPTTAWIDRSTGTVDWTESGRGVVTTTSELIVLAHGDGTFVGRRPDGTVAWEDGLSVTVQSKSHSADEFVYAPLEVLALEDAFVAASAGSNRVEKWDSNTGTQRWALSLEAAIDTLLEVDGDVYALAEGAIAAIRTD